MFHWIGAKATRFSVHQETTERFKSNAVQSMVDLNDERNGSNGSETRRPTSIPLRLITQNLRSVLTGVLNRSECRDLNHSTLTLIDTEWNASIPCFRGLEKTLNEDAKTSR